jgi:hypothetical protein
VCLTTHIAQASAQRNQQHRRRRTDAAAVGHGACCVWCCGVWYHAQHTHTLALTQVIEDVSVEAARPAPISRTQTPSVALSPTTSIVMSPPKTAPSVPAVTAVPSVPVAAASTVPAVTGVSSSSALATTPADASRIDTLIDELSRNDGSALDASRCVCWLLSRCVHVVSLIRTGYVVSLCCDVHHALTPRAAVRWRRHKTVHPRRHRSRRRQHCALQVSCVSVCHQCCHAPSLRSLVMLFPLPQAIRYPRTPRRRRVR